ncbi:MAG TPA: hypothetical protein VHU40_00805 [Polyangia bacterium]|nr:hypothetical protein [Polyangia bacterium]
MNLKTMLSTMSRGEGQDTRVRPRGARRGLIVAILAACLCGPATAAWATPASAPIAETGASPSTQPSYAATKGGAQASSYAAREGESKDLETFKGGEPVVIVTSTAVLIVAVIILILLI